MAPCPTPADGAAARRGRGKSCRDGRARPDGHRAGGRPRFRGRDARAGGGVRGGARATGRRRRGEPEGSRPVRGGLSGDAGPPAADVRPDHLRAGLRVRHHHLQPAQAAARARVDAGDVRADLRDVQDVPDHAGQVPAHSRDLHRRRDPAVFRRVAASGARARGDHSRVQRARHRRQLRRGLVRHSREHVRQLAHGVRVAAGQALSLLLHSAPRRHEHRHAADQRRTHDDAVHPAVRARRLRGLLLHRLRDRRVARRLGAAHRRRHLHQDRRHRVRPDEDRVQHQGGRRPQPRA